MTRKEYVEKRKALVAEAEAYANEGSVEKFNAKKAEIEALDAEYDAAIKAKANARALREQLQDLSAGLVGGEESAIAGGHGRVIDRMAGQEEPVITRWGVTASAERGKALKALNAVKL